MNINNQEQNSIEDWCKNQINKNKERIRSIMVAAKLIEEEPVRTPHPSIKKPTKRKDK